MELAAALLVVSGLTSVATTLLTEFGGTSTGVIGLLILGLNGLMVATGLLIRKGRAWVLALNVSAIALFLELTLLPSAFAVLFAAMDGLVLFTLLRHADWFRWTPDDGVPRQDPGERP